MRTALLTAVLLALSTQPAFAIHPGNGGGNNNSKTGTIKVVNSSDQEVEVSAGGDFYAVEPNGGSFEFVIYTTNRTERTVSARLPGIPESVTSATATLQANKTTVATVSVAGSTVSIAVAKPSNVAKLLREAGVALASSGGLLPLLCLGILLGRRPSRPREIAAD